MSAEPVLFEIHGRVARITLNRPEAMNAINVPVWMAMGHALDRFAADPELWAAVITGAGDRAFSAGADLKAIAAGELVITEQMAAWGFAGVVRRFCPKPVVAAVNGFALGGGTEIALWCDLIVASERASFGLPEVKRGLIAAAGGLMRLPRQLPMKIAMQHIFTGDPMPASDALRWGLVNQVVPHERVVDEAMALAERICANAPVSVRTSKEIAYRALDATIDFPGDAWDINARLAGVNRSSEDAKEGPRAFAEKRTPNWTGR